MRGIESSQAKYFREVIRESVKLRQRTQLNIECAIALRHHMLRECSRFSQEWMEISDLLAGRESRTVDVRVGSLQGDFLLKASRDISEETKPAPCVAEVLYTDAGFVLLPPPVPLS